MNEIGAHILDSARVGDCMRAGIFTCERQAPVRELAATMSSLRVHALAVRGDTPTFLSDLDVLTGIARADHLTAGDLVTTNAVTVARTQTLREATQSMVEHGAAHVIVIDEASGHPVGVLSSTDILQVYAAAAAVSE